MSDKTRSLKISEKMHAAKAFRINDRYQSLLKALEQQTGAKSSELIRFCIYYTMRDGIDIAAAQYNRYRSGDEEQQQAETGSGANRSRQMTT